MSFPDNWPRCPVCDDYALDGHITCGRVECNESEQRNKRGELWRRPRMFSREPPYTEREIKRSQEQIRALFRAAGIPLADEDY
jgi:hypothetical protein